jgi:hypothetical protein
MIQFDLYKQHCVWSIDRPVLDDEIDNWLTDQNISAYKTYSNTRSVAHMVLHTINGSSIMRIEFENEIDAVAFRLRWL